MRAMLDLALFTVVVLLAACRDPVITCEVDSFCVSGGRLGRCVPAGSKKYCAFPDVACPSGWSWDSTAADPFAGTCVVAWSPDAGVDLLKTAEADMTASPDLGVPDLSQPGIDLSSSMDGPPLRRWVDHSIGSKPYLLGVWGDSAGRVYVVGNDSRTNAGLISTTTDGGLTWKSEAVSTPAPLMDIWGTGPTNVYAGGLVGYLFRFDGSTWTKLSGFGAADSVTRIWGASANDIYVVTASGVRRTSDQGQSWKSPNLGTAKIAMVGGTSSFNVFAVGPAGTILHSVDNGGTWMPKASGTTANLVTLWAHKSGIIVAVGEGGTILFSNTSGAKWTVQDSGTSNLLSGVWGSGPNDIYVVGQNGMILHTVDAGKTWTPEVSGTTEVLTDIWGSGPDDVYVVGTNGTVLHLE